MKSKQASDKMDLASVVILLVILGMAFLASAEFGAFGIGEFGLTRLRP